MYHECVRRTTPKRNPQFLIRRCDIPFDRRTAYVEGVCSTLVESRFGPGRVEPIIVNLSNRPERERAVFYDLADDGLNGLLPCYNLSPLGRAGYQMIEAAYRRAKQMGLLDAGPPTAPNSAAFLPPNL